MLSAASTDMSRRTRLASRLLALNVLCDLQKTGDPVTRILERQLAEIKVDSRDAQLARALIFGILRQQQYLDYIIGRFSRHPVTKMKPRTLIALRIGVYQLLLMDRIPASAAVNETVNAFKAGRQPTWLVRFVNGVLRSVVRELSQLPQPGRERVNGNPVLNHPEWLVRKWVQLFGREKTYNICRVNNEPPPLTLRVNTTLIDQKQLVAKLTYGGRVELGKYCATALVLPDFRGEVAGLFGYEEGYFAVQDEAAQLATGLLSLKENGRYLDGCAGVGGKTGHLAALLPPGGHLTAIEPEKKRFRLLGENLHRLKVSGVVTMHMNLAEFADKTDKQYDGILLDVPCSGTGVIRRRPDIRWNRLPEDLQSRQKQQLQLLRTVIPLLKEDGIIVYATCSLEAEENSEVIDAFLAEHGEFILEDARRFLPPAAEHLVTAEGYFQPTPDQGLDGFFAARLRRRGV